MRKIGEAPDWMVVEVGPSFLTPRSICFEPKIWAWIQALRELPNHGYAFLLKMF